MFYWDSLMFYCSSLLFYCDSLLYYWACFYISSANDAALALWEFLSMESL